MGVDRKATHHTHLHMLHVLRSECFFSFFFFCSNLTAQCGHLLLIHTKALDVLTLSLLAALSFTKIRKDLKMLEVPECEVGARYIVLWLYIAFTILFSQKLIYVIVYLAFSEGQQTPLIMSISSIHFFKDSEYKNKYIYIYFKNC